TRASRSGPLPSIGSHIGVRIAAGWIELHRMLRPCSAHHRATVFVWLRTAVLEEAYAAAAGIPTMPEREEMLTIDPAPARRIALMPCWQPRKTPSRLVRCTARQSSSR